MMSRKKILVSKDYCSTSLWSIDRDDFNFLGNLSYDGLGLSEKAIEILDTYDKIWERICWDSFDDSDKQEFDDRLDYLQLDTAQRIQLMHPEYDVYPKELPNHNVQLNKEE